MIKASFSSLSQILIQINKVSERSTFSCYFAKHFPGLFGAIILPGTRDSSKRDGLTEKETLSNTGCFPTRRKRHPKLRAQDGEKSFKDQRMWVNAYPVFAFVLFFWQILAPRSRENTIHDFQIYSQIISVERQTQSSKILKMNYSGFEKFCQTAG